MSLRDQAGSSPASQQDESQIDLTPMLDVVFIMLIFFIVTSSFVKEPALKLISQGDDHRGVSEWNDHFRSG